MSNMSTEYLDNMEIILNNIKIKGFQKYNTKIKEKKKKKFYHMIIIIKNP